MPTKVKLGQNLIFSAAPPYQSTGDRELLRRLKYVLKELKLCQEAGKDGFLLGVKGGRELFREVASGKIKTNNPKEK